MQKAAPLFVFLFFAPAGKATSQQRLPLPADSSARTVSLKVLPQNFYKKGLPLSCKSELQLQKLTSLPLYFRLGSKDYVDYLEKKPNAVKQP